MKAEDRTRLVMKALGWQGGTVHDLCKTLALDSHTFLYGDVAGVGDMASEFTGGWFGVRTCSPEYFREHLTAKHRGNLQFWFGVAAGLNCAELGND